MRLSPREPYCEPLAQSVEHLPFKQRVAGSIPARLISDLRRTPFVTGSPRAQVGLRDEGSATPARPLDGYRARHAVLVGSVRSHAIVFVTPEVRRAHALLRAAVSNPMALLPKGNSRPDRSPL